MADYLTDAAARALAMFQEALNPLVGGKVDIGYWPYQQDAFPYVIVRHAGLTVDPTKYAEDIESNPESLLVRLVVGHFTEGYAGETQARAFSYYAAIRDYFRGRKSFTTDSNTYGDFSSDPDYLEPDTEDWISSHTGLVIFTNSGVLAAQLAYEFTLQIPYLQSVY
jgi:hypothetical protein